jgi:uncharacterized protein YacL
MRRPLLLWIIRGVFIVAVLGTATMIGQDLTNHVDTAVVGDLGAVMIVIGAFLGIIGFGALVIWADVYLRHKDIKTLSALYFGLLLGLLFGNLITTALIPILETQESKWIMLPMRLLVTTLFCYICVSTLVQTKDDFRFIIPYVEFSKQVKGGRPLVLDTSVIIDGRIADICETKIIDTKLIVPRFVLQELQGIADSSEKLKRNRGRRGIDILKKMQSSAKVDLEIHEGNIPELREIREVDQRIVVLAKVLGARVVTNDFNLNKIAQLQGVEVINLNELSNAMKSIALPGETLTVRLIKPGDQLGQGVGYLDDGTMVVAEQGRNYIGQEVHITVTSILQTSAGRMIFGKVESRSSPAPALAGAGHQAEVRG